MTENLSELRPPVENPPPHWKMPKGNYSVWWLRHLSIFDGDEPHEDSWDGVEFNLEENGLDPSTINRTKIITRFILPQDLRGMRVVVAWVCYDPDMNELFGS